MFWSFVLLQSDRLKQVQDYLCTLNSLCLVLGMDFKQTIGEIHPSLADSEVPKNISNATIELLAAAIQKLRAVKIQRMQRVNFVLWCLFFPVYKYIYCIFSVYLVDHLCTDSYKILQLLCWSYGT